MSKKNLKGRALVIRLDKDELRVALMILGAAEPTLLHSVVLPVPDGAVDDGYIVQPEVVKELLSTALLEPEFRRCNRAVFSLCTTQIITELATAPVLNEKKLDKMLRSNMDMYFPVDTKDYNLVWKINGNAKNEEGKSELSVQLWAVSNSVLARYYAIANDCGLNVEAIQWCGSSVVSFARGIYEPPVKKKSADAEQKEKESTLYVVAEREHMIVTIMQGQSVRSQRMFQCGPDPEMALREVSMLVDYYNTRIGSYGSHFKCVFGGKLASDPEFIQSAQFELGMPITVVDGPEWFLCYGTSVAEMDFGDPNMNRRISIKRSMGGLWQYVLILIAGGILVLTAVYTLSSAEIWRRDIDRLEDTQLLLRIKYSETQDYANNYNNYISKYSAYSSDWDTLFGSVKTYNDNLVSMLSELESVLPETTKVTAIVIQPTGLQLRIACPSKEEAAYVIMELRELQYADLLAISSLSGATGQAAKGNPNEKVPTEGSAGGIDLEGLLGQLQNGGNISDILGSLGGNTEDLEDILGNIDQDELEDILGNLGSGDLDDILGDSGLEFGGISADTIETITQLLGGGSDISKLSESDRAALLRYGIDKNLITRDDVVAEIEALDMKDVVILEDIYGNLPETEMSLSFLQSESTTAQKKAAIVEMIETDSIARYHFTKVFNEDMNRKNEILYSKIKSDLTSSPKAYSALLSGGKKDLEKNAPEIARIITKNDSVVKATETLICTKDELAERYAWYLEQAVYHADDKTDKDETNKVNPVDGLNSNRLATDIINNTVSSALGAEARKLTSNIRDAVILKLFTSGKLSASDLSDVLKYLKPTIAVPTPTPSQKPTPTPTPSQKPGGDSLQDLLDQLLGNKGEQNGTGAGDGTAVDRNIYFDVVLGYDIALVAEEMERAGLSYDDKVVPPAELEVGQ